MKRRHFIVDQSGDTLEIDLFGKDQIFIGTYGGDDPDNSDDAMPIMLDVEKVKQVRKILNKWLKENGHKGGVYV